MDNSNENYSDKINEYTAGVCIGNEQVWDDQVIDYSARSIGEESIAPHYDELKDYFEKNKDDAIAYEVAHKYPENEIEVTDWYPSNLTLKMEDSNREYTISKVLMRCAINNTP